MKDSEISNALNEYIAKLDRKGAERRPEKPDHYDVNEGRKYYRIVEISGFDGRKQVFCFVDKTNGDILKSDSWFRPAKGKRGSIFDEKVPLDFGELYLR